MSEKKNKVELILLAAGRGSRMGKLTDSIPKALLPVKGVPIIEHTARAFYNIFPSEVLRVVTGYNREAFEKWALQRGWAIDLAYNKFWSEYGPTGSLSAGLDKEFDVQILLVGNGDTLFNYEVFDKVKKVATADGFYLVSSKINKFEQDSMLLDVKEQKVQRAGKRILIEPFPEWESSGLLVVKGEANVNLIRNKVRSLVRQITKGVQSDGPWHEIVNLLVREKQKVFVVEVPENSWLECDTHQCILNAEKLLG